MARMPGIKARIDNVEKEERAKERRKTRERERQQELRQRASARVRSNFGSSNSNNEFVSGRTVDSSSSSFSRRKNSSGWSGWFAQRESR
jgi:hypothetical protein